MPLLRFFLLLLVVQVAHLVAMAVVGTWVGGRVKMVRLGFGPELFRFAVFGFDVGLGPLPFGGYVQFWRAADEEERLEGMTYFDELPGALRALVQLSGPICLFLLACVGTLSFAWRPVYAGFSDYVLGALSPRTLGASLLNEALAAIRTAPALPLFGLVCAKLAAWNVLPVPPLNGGSAILDLCLPNDEGGQRIAMTLSAVGMFVLLVATIAWCVAFWTFVWQ